MVSKTQYLHYMLSSLHILCIYSSFALLEPETDFTQFQILDNLSIFIFILALARASAWAGVSSSTGLDAAI